MKLFNPIDEQHESKDAIYHHGKISCNGMYMEKYIQTPTMIPVDNNVLLFPPFQNYVGRFSGCASVLKTYSSKLITEGSANRR